jgi:hypothetical protein
MLYFGSLYNKIIIDSPFKASFIFQAGLVTIAGLLLTSFCWSIELSLRRIGKSKYIPSYLKFDKYFPDIKFERIARLESNQKGSQYLYQVYGQAVMHLNIWIGTIIFISTYIIYSLINKERINKYAILIGIVIVVANFFVSKNLFRMSRSSMESAISELPVNVAAADPAASRRGMFPPPH